MNTYQYVVERLDGDYANLRRIGGGGEEGADGNTVLVARALLPEEIREGTKLLYEWLEYKIMEEQP